LRAAEWRNQERILFYFSVLAILSGQMPNTIEKQLFLRFERQNAFSGS
jgi:hypothetical protein